MADSLLSLSRFLSLETESEVAAEDDDEDEMNEHFTSLIEDEEYLQLLLDKEKSSNCIDTRIDDWIETARSEAIQWIFNMRSHLPFQFHTAYLSVTYFDRFLAKIQIASDKPWAIQLLAIACLSLAAKMNEHKKRSNWALNIELQFQKSVIQRAELLVLSTLDWRMHSITPFHFIRYFVSCLCKEASPERRFVSLISQIICAAINDMDIMARRSSTIAMAATFMAMDQDLRRESMEMKVKTNWDNQLFDHADVYSCYSRMLKLEPLKVNIIKPDPANKEESPSSKDKESIKRKRS